MEGEGRNGLLDAALAYVKRGWHVLPLHWITDAGRCSCGRADCSPGKHPLTKNGLLDGSADEATVRAWWARWPKANIGVRTGPESGLLMIGPDGEAGLTALAGLEAANGALPPTAVQRSGGGGKHYLFAYPAGITINNDKNHRNVPIDVRGAGGYFVAAPSTNGAGPYAWEVLPEQIPPAPGWLLDWARKDNAGNRRTFTMGGEAGQDIPSRAKAYLDAMPPAISGRGGHDATMAAARVVCWGFNLGAEVGYDLLANHYNPRCVPPWSEKELLHKVSDADTKPFDKPRGYLLGQAVPAGAAGPAHLGPPPPPPPWRAFPTHLLPPTLARFVHEVAASVGCDEAHVAIPALVAAAGCVGSTHRIKLKRSWSEPCVFWALVVAPSGSGKSPPFEKATAPLEEIEHELHRQNEAAWLAYRTDRTKYEAARRAAAKEGKELVVEPEEPADRRLVIEDITIEKVAELLDDNPRGLLLASEEAAAWFGSFSRYKAGGKGVSSSDVPRWLKLHGARTLTVDRKTGDRRTVRVPNAAVSVTGTIQPDVLREALTPGYFQSGLVARLLLVRPPRTPRRWTDAEVDEKTTKDYAGVLGKLWALEPAKGEDDRARPALVKMTPEAHALWVKFFDAHGLRQDDAEEDVLAAFAKLEAYCARFALLFHLVKECSDPAGDPNNPIKAETVGEAVALTEWFVHETERLYALFGEGPAQREVRGLVELIRRHGGRITVRGLMLARRKTYPTADVAEAALVRLVAGGQAEWQEVPPGAAGGRPTRFCVLRDPPPDPGGGPDEPPAHTTPATPDKPLEKEGCVCSVFCAPGPPSREPPGREGDGRGRSSAEPGSQDTQHTTHTTPFPQGNEGGSGGCVRKGEPPPAPPVPPGPPAEGAEGPVDPAAPPNPQADREVGEL